MISCVSGVTIRMSVASVSEQGRATQGVKLIKVDDGDEIAAITKLDEKEEEIEGVVEAHAHPIEPIDSTEITDSDTTAESDSIEE
jgi:DNA gyrase subunit A